MTRVRLASVPIQEDELVGVSTEDHIELVKKRLTRLFGWPKQPSQGRYSVIGGDDFEVYVEEHVAKPFPEKRPHYE